MSLKSLARSFIERSVLPFAPSSWKLPSLMLVGTDTEVGKTFTGCCILRQMSRSRIRVGAYKPVASGMDGIQDSDGYRLWQATGRMGSIGQVNPQYFIAPLAPPIAARLEGKLVDDALLVQGAIDWQGNCEALLIEGVGGLFSPLSDRWTNAQFALALGCPLVLVAHDRLGVVHQVLTSILAAEAMGLAIRCVVLNQVEPQLGVDRSIESNEQLLKSFLQGMTQPPLVVRLAFQSDSFESEVDWRAMMDASSAI